MNKNFLGRHESSGWLDEDKQTIFWPKIHNVKSQQNHLQFYRVPKVVVCHAKESCRVWCHGENNHHQLPISNLPYFFLIFIIKSSLISFFVSSSSQNPSIIHSIAMLSMMRLYGSAVLYTANYGIWCRGIRHLALHKNTAMIKLVQTC